MEVWRVGDFDGMFEPYILIKQVVEFTFFGGGEVPIDVVLSIEESGISNSESRPGADGEEGGWDRASGSLMSMPIVDGWCGVAGAVLGVALFVGVV